MTDLAPLEFGEGSSQLVGYLLPWIAPAHEDEDRSVSQCPHELAKEDERGIVTVATRGVNQRDETIVTLERKIVVPKRPAGDAE